MKFIFFLLFTSLQLFGSIDLSIYEASLYSQNGEDGILAKLFELIPPKTRTCIDLGAGDGITGSRTYLLRLQGYQGLLIDRAFETREYNLHKEFLTKENINETLEKYGATLECDFLSLDTHYNDYHFWQAISPKYRPRIVAISYNGTLPKDQALVVKYRPYFVGDGTSYFGASLLALYNLGREKSYSLIYVDQTGSTLFFVRDDVLEENHLNFMEMNEVEKLYRPLTHPIFIKTGLYTIPK